MASLVKYSFQAEDDLDGILKWLLERGAGEAGVRWFQGFRKAINSLDTFPERCTLARESDSFPFELRQLLYGRKPHVYRVLFVIEGDTVYILRLRHVPHNAVSL